MRWLKLTSLKIRGWVLVTSKLMLFSTFSLFLCFVFKLRSAENQLSQRYVDTKGTKTRKASNVIFVYEWYIILCEQVFIKQGKCRGTIPQIQEFML